VSVGVIVGVLVIVDVIEGVGVMVGVGTGVLVSVGVIVGVLVIVGVIECVGVDVGAILGVGVSDSCGKHTGSIICNDSLGLYNILTYQTFLLIFGYNHISSISIVSPHLIYVTVIIF
jgi:hypothetical protein